MKVHQKTIMEGIAEAEQEKAHTETKTGTERPILFSTLMVQAILSGIKTQTRRIVDTTSKGWDAQKLELSFTENLTKQQVEKHFQRVSTQKEMIGFHAFFKDNGNHLGTKCPYGQPGDLLWVRETWTGDIFSGSANAFIYKASNPNHRNADNRDLKIWKPSIHMPKAAARIWLRVKEIGVEHLQDIKPIDAIAEGILPLSMSSMQLAQSGQLYFDYTKPKQLFNEGLPPFWSFSSLWCSINGDDSWEATPWVWVVKFEVLSTTGRPSFDSAQDDKSISLDEAITRDIGEAGTPERDAFNEQLKKGVENE